MNHREPPHCAAGLRRALRFASLLLVPTLVPKSVSGGARSHPNADAALDLREETPRLLPYLPVLGSPPLRFQMPQPPPDLTVRPAAGAPPIPSAPPHEPIAAAPVASLDPKPAPAPATAPTEVAANVEKSAPASAKAPPPAIIPDDARPSIRPEDFLPYFQIPGSGKPGEPTMIVPASALRGGSGSLPVAPSSATYTQSK